MLTYKIYKHYQRNGDFFFTSHWIVSTERNFLWFKWMDIEEYGITKSGGTLSNDWSSVKLKSLEEAREVCAYHAEHRKKLENEKIVKVEHVATDTLNGY